MQVRQKVPVLQAMKYTGDNLLEVLTFTGRHPKFNEWFKSDLEYTEFVRKDGNAFKIIGGSLGSQRVEPGMWVLRNENGYCFATSEDILKKNYEEV